MVPNAQAEEPPPSNNGLQFFEGGAFRTEAGEVIPDLVLCYETWGRPAQGRSNVIVLCHERSGDHRSLGAFIGPGRVFDPERYYVVTMDALGAGQSTTPSASGLGMRFPWYTIRDMVRAQCLALTKGLGVTQVRCVVGPSMGAYMALEWAVMYPPFVRSAACVLPSARCTPQLLAVHEAMRTALATDPAWLDGAYTTPPQAGLAAAATVAFPWRYGEEWYLQYQLGDQYRAKLGLVRERAQEYEAIDLWYQSLACDSHDVAAPYGSDLATALGRYRSPVLLMPCVTDILVPPRNAQLMQQLLPNAQYVEISSFAGHAAGLLEVEFISDAVQTFLAGR